MANRTPRNLRGHVSGRLVATAFLGLRNRAYYWRCRCQCGGYAELRAWILWRCITKSCGCLPREVASARNKKHGLGSTPEAAIWRAMIARCHNPKCRAYRWYGERGIKVCQRWRDSFVDFLSDVGKRPDGKDLDRINNDGDYEPGNFRWVDRKINQRNRRGNLLVTVGGQTKTLAEWAESSKVAYGTAWKRLRLGWTPERALGIEHALEGKS